MTQCNYQSEIFISHFCTFLFLYCSTVLLFLCPNERAVIRMCLAIGYLPVGWLTQMWSCKVDMLEGVSVTDDATLLELFFTESSKQSTNCAQSISPSSLWWHISPQKNPPCYRCMCCGPQLVYSIHSPEKSLFSTSLKRRDLNWLDVNQIIITRYNS